MMKTRFQSAMALVFLTMPLLATNIFAGEVLSGLSSEQTYVGMPVTLQIQFRNISKHEPPELPEVDGLRIESSGTAAQSSQITIINGRRSENLSLTYAYTVTPTREGDFVIPAMTVNYDGRKELLPSFRISASKSETGDLVCVEVVSRNDSAYVGQSVELTLRIWIKPYEDAPHRLTLSEGDMWNLIARQTEWGVFTDRMLELQQNNQRPGGKEVQREDAEGKSALYYLYEIDATIYPQRPGSIDVDDCRIVVQYPTQLGRSRSPLSGFFDDAFSSFGSRLAITASRPLVAEASVASIEIKPIPTDGRPIDYRGAVGQYAIHTEATPTKVGAGDPITLHLTLSGNGPMDRLQPPRLIENQELTRQFRVSDEPLAGIVNNNEKRFSTTIRPLSEQTTEIPPIRFSYFDPVQEQFVTVQSDAIPVDVHPAETLSLDAIVSAGDSSARTIVPSDNADQTTAAMLLPTAYPASLMLEQQTIRSLLRPAVVLSILLPPLTCALMILIARRRKIAATLRHSLMPWTYLERQLAAAETPSAIRQSLFCFLREHFRMQDASEMAMIGRLRSDGNKDSAVRLEHWLDQYEKTETGMTTHSPDTIDRLRETAKQLAAECVAGKLAAKRDPKTKRNAAGYQQLSARTLVPLLALNLSVATSVVAAGTMPLNETQQRSLIEEANELYSQASLAMASDPETAKQGFRAAAEKYQIVVDAGTHNAELFFTLGNAYRHSEALGRAVANYRKAIRLRPDERRFQQALQQLSADSNRSNLSTLQRLIGSVFAALSRRMVLWAALIVWGIAWLAFAKNHILGGRERYWIFSTAAALSVCLFAVVVAHQLAFCRSDRAIVVLSQRTLRASDTANAASVSGPLGETTEVKVIGQRGKWLKVTTADAVTGWIETESVEFINPGGRVSKNRSLVGCGR